MKRNKKVKNTHEQGYVSFSPEDLQNAGQQDSVNQKAYKYLDLAMTTSSHITAKVKDKFNNGGTVNIDDVYPITKEETLEMEQLLDKAEQAAGNPDNPLFSDRLGELRAIVEFSKKRHWNFSWLVIIGVLVMVGYLWYNMGEAQKDAQRAKNDVALVQNWTEQDTIIEISAVKKIEYSTHYTTANKYKAYTLNYIASNYNYNKKMEEQHLASADTASSAERKADYMKYAKEYKADAERNLAKYNELNGMKFKQVQEMALEETGMSEDRRLSNSRSSTLWCIFFIFLIPLYIFAERPYGYTISRYRTESKVKAGIMRWTYAISAGLASAASAMSLIDTITTYSDGHKERTTEASTNAPIIAIKVLLYLAAIFILCIVSCFIMLWSTITGLKRNYDWKEIFDKLNQAVAKKKNIS